MSRLPERNSSMHGSHHLCHICQKEFGKYIYKEEHWCRECLDKEQYPKLAHLTQAEREELRRKAIDKTDDRASIVNVEGVKAGF